MNGRQATDGMGFHRSAGVFSQKDAERLRNRGNALAFDPLQQGWVLQDCEDDLEATLNGCLRIRTLNKVPGLSWRNWTSDDVPVLREALSDSDIWTFLPEDFEGALTDTQAHALIEVANTFDLHDVQAVTKDGHPIGQVRLQFNSRSDGAAELSYWFAKAVWGQGVASEVLPRYLDRIQSVFPKIKTLTARVHQKNAASGRLLNKLGFEPVRHDGNWVFLDRPNGQ